MMAKTNNKNKRKTKTVMKHSIRKPKGLYLEEHLNWKDLPEDVKEFLVQTEIADNKTYVQVFYNIDKSKTFHAPKEAGDLWTVFDYNNSTSTNDCFTHINAMSSQGSPENVDNH